MIATSTINCSFSNPLWILKSGEVRTLEPLETAGTNANFQFASSTCVITQNLATTTSAYNGFTYGEIVISLFLFLILLQLVFSFFIAKFLGIKIHKNV